ncbi:FAD/NAD binding oxidoreductase [Halarchaeum acidiphilum MH1-52-1]|uniref:FAD/NAD binding oxidoreductase n=1 Tax=Halarchaeum acidiphilum MH1-52-1 TaxID=1261545 RepID=U3A4P4_9EURY|nr:FAD-dependent oxidoreductase [Halarchaeum acidiphilum]GAD52614.1 FAD/NAD binding oxidoreductase [Halarchaeum acidiphilum MH1-52-1]
MPTLTVAAVADVGPQTVAIELDAPASFDAAPGQFVLVRRPGDGDAGYYTISSPDAAETFEITVGSPEGESPEESLGTWLAARDVGDVVEIEGPLGNVEYRGEGDVAVYAAGPGIGPAVGVAERAVEAGHDATVVYRGENPPHRARLDALRDAGATVAVVDALDELDADHPTVPTPAVYVFGFDDFVEDVKALLEDADRDPAEAAIESFGPA